MKGWVEDLGGRAWLTLPIGNPLPVSSALKADPAKSVSCPGGIGSPNSPEGLQSQISWGHSQLLPWRRFCERVHAAVKAIPAAYSWVPEDQGIIPRELLGSATLDIEDGVAQPLGAM